MPLGQDIMSFANLSRLDLNLAEGFIRPEDSKNGEPREVPLTPNLEVRLKAVTTGRKPDPSLFPVKDMPVEECVTHGNGSARMRG